MDTDLTTLATYRLDRGLSLRELAAEMAAAGWPVPFRTLHGVLNEGVEPLETTAHAIRKFVEHERKAGRLPWTPARARKAIA